MEQSCYEAFLEYLKSERNYSPRTVESYGTDIKEFAAFCEELNESITWQTVDADIVRAWIVDCLDKGKMKASSVNRKLSAVRTMYHYLVMMGQADKNPARNITGPKRGKALPAFVKEFQPISSFFQPCSLRIRDCLRTSFQTVHAGSCL